MKVSHYPCSRMLAGLLLLLFTICSSVNATTKCYKPNGDLALNDQPCFPQNPVSSCCGGSTYVCSTNNLCAHYSGEYFVIGSCTDKTWNSPACPGYCFFRDHVHNSVFRCSADTYCCADGPSCNCTTGINTEAIDDFLPDYSDLVGSAATPNTAVATSSLFTPIGASSKRITTAPASTADSSSTTHVVTTSSSAAADALPTPSESASEGSHANSKALTIGLGVGLSLGGVAVILLVLLCFMWRRSKRNKQPIEASQTQYPYQTQLPPPPPPQAPVEAPAHQKPYTHHPRVNSAELPVYEAPGHGI